MAYGNMASPMPYQRCVDITTSDATPIATGRTDAILFRTTGNAVLVDTAGNVTTITGAAAGLLLPLEVARVNATGTTATVSALYIQ